MKTNIIITLLVAAFALGACAQKVSVPEPVQKAFDKKFTNITKVKWESEDEGFEAGFKMDGIKMEALFDKNGNFIEMESPINIDELPAGIMEYVKENYEGAEVEDAEKIETAGGELMYEVEVEIEKDKKEIEFDLLFDMNGKFIKKEMEDEEEDDD